MLRQDISVSDCLANGAMEVIKESKCPALSGEQIEETKLPDCLVIKFDTDTIGIRTREEDSCIGITSAVGTFQATQGYGEVERRILLLILSWALKWHKL